MPRLRLRCRLRLSLAKDGLPAGPAALGHPTNKDPFVGTPGSGDDFVMGIPVRLALPMVAVENFYVDCREAQAKG
jgi:hypothetical protein